jgi:hypothetical protein
MAEERGADRAMFFEVVVGLIGKAQTSLAEICDVDGRIVLVGGDVAAEEGSAPTSLELSKRLDESVLIGDSKSSLQIYVDWSNSK